MYNASLRCWMQFILEHLTCINTLFRCCTRVFLTPFFFHVEIHLSLLYNLILQQQQQQQKQNNNKNFYTKKQQQKKEVHELRKSSFSLLKLYYTAIINPILVANVTKEKEENIFFCYCKKKVFLLVFLGVFLSFLWSI